VGDGDLDKWISEIAKAWNSSGLLGKVLMIFACIGASTTLTSLSGIIIEWKGLIAEMLSFYSQYVRGPIADITRFVTFDLIRPSGLVVDAILLYLIYFSAEKRVIGKLSERSALNSSLFIMTVIVLPIVLLSVLMFVLFVLDKYVMQGIWGNAKNVAIAVPLLMICGSLSQGIRSLVWLAKGNCPEGLVQESQPLLYRREIRQFVQFTTPLAIAFLVLALLTSINLGLA